MAMNADENRPGMDPYQKVRSSNYVMSISEGKQR